MKNTSIITIIISVFICGYAYSEQERISPWIAFKDAQRLSKNGDFEGAFRKLLICWDSDGSELNNARENYGTIRRDAIARGLKRMIADYHEGIQDIQLRFNLLAEKVTYKESCSEEAVLDIITLGYILEDDDKVIEILQKMESFKFKRYLATKIIDRLSREKKYELILELCDSPIPHLNVIFNLSNLKSIQGYESEQTLEIRNRLARKAKFGPKSQTYFNLYYSAAKKRERKILVKELDQARIKAIELGLFDG